MNIKEGISLLVIVIFSIIIFCLNKKRNAWDILFFNATLAIIILFLVGILARDIGVWKIVAGALGVIATGERIASFFIGKDKKE